LTRAARIFPGHPPLPGPVVPRLPAPLLSAQPARLLPLLHRAMAVVAQALQLAAPELHPVTPVRLYVIRHVSWGDPTLPLAVPAQRLFLELCGPLCSPSAIRVPVGVLALSHSAPHPTDSAPDAIPRPPRAQGGCSTSTRQPACPGPPRWRSSDPPSDS